MAFAFCIPMVASAAVKDQGSCGTNATWTLTTDRSLTISGSGIVSPGEWDQYKDYVNTITFAEGSNITEIDTSAFCYFSNLKNLNLPATLRTIGVDAFGSCKTLQTVVIPISVTRINEYAFSECGSLKKVVFKEGSNLKTIDKSVFSDCKMLSTVDISKLNYLEEIGDDAFRFTAVNKMVFPKNIKVIGKAAFQSCSKLETVSCKSSNNLTIIDDSAFSNCAKLNAIELPEGLEAIGEYAFEKTTSLQSLTIPTTVTSIGQRAVWDSGVKKITIRKGTQMKELGAGSFFAAPKLKTVSLPNGITSIGDGAFSSCESLLFLDIPETVQTIGRGALMYDTGMKYVYFPDDSQLYSINNWFDFYHGKNQKLVIICPNDSYAADCAKQDSLKQITSGSVKKYRVKNVKVKRLKKAFTVSYSADRWVYGYQIQYSLKKNMSKAKTVYTTAKSKKISKLKSKKYYYVKVRPYIIANQQKMFGKWSSKKKVKTK